MGVPRFPGPKPQRHAGKQMFNVRLILIISLIVFILPVTLSFSQPFTKQSDLDFLKKERDRFSNYAQEFLDIAESHPIDLVNPVNPLERDTTIQGLYYVASTVFDHLFASYMVLALYRGVSSKTDRAGMRPLIKEALNYYARQVDDEIKVVNLALSHTESPAIATFGTQMKEELREIKSRLKSIELR